MTTTSDEEKQKSVALAPNVSPDVKKCQWRSFYPIEAKNAIYNESLFLIILATICMIGVFYVLYHVNNPLTLTFQHDSVKPPEGKPFSLMVILGAWFAGIIGGCCFGAKCLYHYVAIHEWNEDRRLWRCLAPPFSGFLSVFMVLLVASGLLQLFDKDFLQNPIRVIAFSFLVGYFSDKALEKMKEIANTLFGEKKQENSAPNSINDKTK